MGGLSGCIIRCLPPHLRFLLFSDADSSSLTLQWRLYLPLNRLSSRIRASCRNQLADPVIPCGYLVRSKKALLEEQISAQRCCKCRAVIVRRVGIPCTLMSLTLSVCHAWGNPTLTLCSVGLITRTASIFSLASLRSWLAFFSESDSAPRTLPFSSSQGSVRKNSGQRIWAAGDKRAHVGSMPVCLAVTTEGESIHPSSLLNMISAPALWATWSRSVRVRRNRWQHLFLAASDAEVCSGSVTDPALLTSSTSHNARLRADKELICMMTKAVNELGLEWSPLRSHLAAGWTSVFLTGRYQSPPQTLIPLLPRSSYELAILCHAPHSSRIHPSASVALTSVNSAEEKGYENLPPGWICGYTSLPAHSYRMKG